MERTTRIFDRLPPDSGVTFEGFENIKIKSREDVKNKIEEFINYAKNEAKKPAIRVILGEWGEGKTDAYNRYIKKRCEEEGDYSFLVSASTVANCYELSYIQKLFQTTPIQAERFLLALFNGIREESNESKIPNPQNYDDAYKYLIDVLANLIGQEKTKRIFIFIDEFEELLLNLSKLKEIISGIKQTIDGKFRPIDEGGEYEGCVHLVIAATPDAFYQLRAAEETSLIAGGLGRRAGWIELPQIRKEEGIEFLLALLEYSYNGNLPNPLPIEIGVFHTLFRITQGNPGNLVSLFTRVMNGAKLDNSQVKIIDGSFLLDLLEGENVYVFGGFAPALEKDTYNRYRKIVKEQRTKELGDKCDALLKLILGELKPFSVEELEARIGHNNITNIISIINNNLMESEGVERAILKVSPLRKDRTLQDVENAFKDYIIIESDKKYIKIDNYSEPLESFKDRITYFVLNEGKVIPQVYIPSERNSIMVFFEGITEDRAKEIENLVKRKLCEEIDYYVASEELQSQLFPTPIPSEFGFIKNREFRMKLWREITRNLAKEYNDYMVSAFLYLLRNSGLFKVENEKTRGQTTFAQLIDGDGVKINCLFYPINGDVKSTHIEELSKLIKSMKPPVHCAFLLYTGIITDEAQDKIIDKGLGSGGENIIFDVCLHPTLAKRILGIYKASNNSSLEIDKNLLISVIKRIIIQELDFQNKIKSWLKEQEKEGFAILELPLQNTSNLRDIANSLKFYINFMENQVTPKDVFDMNKDLLRFVKYESKKDSIMPDIELPQLTRLTEDLERNGFLDRSDAKYRVRKHPVEKRILDILRREKKLPDSELETYFIIKNPRIIKDVFIPILEYKGLIRQENSLYSLTDPKQLLDEVNQKYAALQTLKNNQDFKKYAQVFMTKKRGCRLFIFQEFEDYIEKLSSQIRQMGDEEIKLQKLSLLNRLLNHFFDEFHMLIQRAKEEVERVVGDINNKRQEVEIKLSNVKEAFWKWFKLTIEIDKISEYEEIISIQKDIESYINLNDQEIKKIVDDQFNNNNEILQIFSYDAQDDKAYYFNPKYYLISKGKEKFDELYRLIKETVEDIDDKFKNLTRKQGEIQKGLREISVSQEAKITHLLVQKLQGLAKDISSNIRPSPSILTKLIEIKDYVERESKNMESNLDQLLWHINYIKSLLEAENSYIKQLKNYNSLKDSALRIFDIDEYKKILDENDKQIHNITNKYESLFAKTNIIQLTINNLQVLREKIDNLRSDLEEFSKEISNVLSQIKEVHSTYFKNLEEYAQNINGILEVAKRRHGIDVKDIEDKLDEIKEICSISNLSSLKLSLSQIESIKNEIRNCLYEKLKSFYTPKELELLQLIIKKTRQEGKEWLPIEELFQAASNELHIENKELNDVLQKLIEEGLLRKGVSLTF